MTEFLLSNGSDACAENMKGRQAVHFAALNGKTGIICQLIRRKIDMCPKDKEGSSPLALAMEGGSLNANVVTLLRLAALLGDDEDNAIADGITNVMADLGFD